MKKDEAIDIIQRFSFFRHIEILKEFNKGEKIFINELPTLKKVENDVGVSLLNNFLKQWVGYVAKRIKVKHVPDKDDIDLITTTILLEYSAFKICEVALIFIKIAQGCYEPLYQKLTTEYILRCFKNHELVRNNYLAKSIQKPIPRKTLTSNEQAQYVILGLLRKRKYKSKLNLPDHFNCN